MSERIDELKQEATELGIDFNPRIGEEKLQAKIDAYYESQETSEKEVEQAVQANEEKATVSETKAETKPAVKGSKPMAQLAKEIYDKARKTRIVTIIDNDQRVNNQTTTCRANWSNQYYDMGTRIFPLNIPVEIPQGFISVLKEVKIPHHVKDSATGLSITTMRSRYTIQYENNE